MSSKLALCLNPNVMSKSYTPKKFGNLVQRFVSKYIFTFEDNLSHKNGTQWRTLELAWVASPKYVRTWLLSFTSVVNWCNCDVQSAYFASTPKIHFHFGSSAVMAALECLVVDHECMHITVRKAEACGVWGLGCIRKMRDKVTSIFSTSR